MTDEDQTMQICAYVPVALSRALDRVAKQKGLARARAIEQDHRDPQTRTVIMGVMIILDRRRWRL